jgi:predicted Rossmann fold nucleotide-binding protein DprA/Smf involved in DNA uptake
MSIAATTQIWTAESPEFPRERLSCLNEKIPGEIRARGSVSLHKQKTVGLICSAKAPASIFLAIHDLAQQWRRSSQVILSGFHSPVEQEAFEILLREPGRSIYCPARGLPKRLQPAWRAALEQGRLAMLSPFPDTVDRPTKETAIYRNRLIAALADEVLIAYAHPGSSTEQLVEEVAGWGKAIFGLQPKTQELYRRTA